MIPSRLINISDMVIKVQLIILTEFIQSSPCPPLKKMQSFSLQVGWESFKRVLIRLWLLKFN